MIAPPPAAPMPPPPAVRGRGRVRGRARPAALAVARRARASSSSAAIAASSSGRSSSSRTAHGRRSTATWTSRWRSAEQQIHAAGLSRRGEQAPRTRGSRRGSSSSRIRARASKVAKGGTVTLTVSTGPPKVAVPAVVGQQWTQAEATLTNLGLKPEEHFVAGNTKGQVTATDPPAGQSVPKGSTVRVNVMSGPALGTVPNVIGDTVQQATTALKPPASTYKLTYVQSDAAQRSDRPPDSGAGLVGGEGHDCGLQVSKGPPLVTVPDVVGYTSQQAVQTLEAAGFQVVQQTRSTDASQQNIVQSQNPLGNTQAPKGSTVTIVIGQSSPAPPPTTTTTTTPCDLASPSPRGHPRGRPLERARDLPGVGTLGRSGARPGAVRDRRGRDRPRRALGARSAGRSGQVP